MKALVQIERGGGPLDTPGQCFLALLTGSSFSLFGSKKKERKRGSNLPGPLPAADEGDSQFQSIRGRGVLTKRGKRQNLPVFSDTIRQDGARGRPNSGFLNGAKSRAGQLLPPVPS